MVRGCIGKLFFLGVVAVALVAAFLYRDRLLTAWAVLRGEPTAAVAHDVAVSPELAASAQEKLDAVARGDHTEAAFATDELQSLLEYRYRDRFPAFVDSPRIRIQAGEVSLSVRVPVDRLPARRGLGEITALLPDTTDLVVRGELLAAEDGKVTFAVDGVSAHSIPLPARLVPAALEMLGRKDEPGLRSDAISVPLPEGTRAAYIRGDSIVILSSGQRPRN
ncbi:MAG: hypothetical protein L0271_02645 [Gemmatimonadetes bacterium]|nr:hypothetical protein [Gemmatimonadota bacterium]